MTKQTKSPSPDVERTLQALLQSKLQLVKTEFAAQTNAAFAANQNTYNPGARIPPQEFTSTDKRPK